MRNSDRPVKKAATMTKPVLNIRSSNESENESPLVMEFA